MKKILITGGAGFIGSNFIHHLLENREYEIVNLDKLTYAGNLENLRDVEKHPRYKFAQGDIADTRFLEQLFEKEQFDGVINFAAETHVDRSIEDSSPFVQTNIVGTHALLEVARAYKIKRYHQVSTDEAYGDLGDNSSDYFTEKTPINPNCPYAAAKASADLLVLSWHETYGLDAIITRCSNNYGPYQFPEKLIPFFLFRAMSDQDLPLYGDGKNIRDWLYVRDHCEAILTAFEKSDPGEVWNIGGHNEKTNIEIAELILQHVPNSKSKITFIEDRKAHDRRYAMDASKIEKQLGWKPTHTFEQALPKTIQWYLQNREWVEQCHQKA
ncbi:dTDP-glucose 4,6-dehydratase [Candidatus Gracilibacteria bacterium]|nr:dTDP-glucose 4,6-dehydratase [Candidatus Gracilibacteria bacterium]MCF7819159.1 dTDP-glucose 4,6-dehydratase [Candidatus Gracilibacteria bacterium]